MLVAMQFILASSSPYRKQLLQRAGFDFKTVRPHVNEETLKKSAPQDVEELSRFLALKKAESLIEKHPSQWIVGCDQIAAVGKRIMHKPGDRDGAIRQLR